MKKILLISTIFLVSLIAIGCASAADVDANDGMIDGHVIANATFNDHNVGISEDAVLPDDSGIVDNKTVPDGSDVIDDDADDDSVEPNDVPFYIDNETIIPDDSDVIDGDTVPDDSGIVDNKTVPDNWGHRGNDSNRPSNKDFPMNLEDIIGYNYDLYIKDIDMTNLDLDITNLGFDFSSLIIDDANAFDPFINLGGLGFNINNLDFKAPKFFNFDETQSISDMVPDYIGCPKYDLGQGPKYNGNLLCLG